MANGFGYSGPVGWFRSAEQNRVDDLYDARMKQRMDELIGTAPSPAQTMDIGGPGGLMGDQVGGQIQTPAIAGTGMKGGMPIGEALMRMNAFAPGFARNQQSNIRMLEQQGMVNEAAAQRAAMKPTEVTIGDPNNPARRQTAFAYPSLPGVAPRVDEVGSSYLPGTGTTVNVAGNKFENKRSEVLGQYSGESFNERIRLAENTFEADSRLDEFMDAQSKVTVEGGLAAPYVKHLKSIALSLGIGDEINMENISNQEVMESIGNKLAINLRSPQGPEGGLTGNTSDRDFAALLAANPGITKTRAGNTLLVEMTKRKHKRMRDVAIMQDEFYSNSDGSNQQRDDSIFRQKIREFYKNNPLTTKEDTDKLNTIISKPALTREEARKIAAERGLEID